MIEHLLIICINEFINSGNSVRQATDVTNAIYVSYFLHLLTKPTVYMNNAPDSLSVFNVH